jgi:adenine-specific DNA-methyltransferase
MRLREQGFVRVGDFDARRGTWSIHYVPGATIGLIERGIVEISGRDDNGVAQLSYAGARPVVVKTVWSRQRHVAGIYGSSVLTAFLGDRGLFQFPKSLYAMRDLLDALLHDKPDAVIVDPFAGSGTTLHATLMLNAADEGRRQCFLITNNEVADEAARRLNREGLFRGDRDFEAQGIFEAVTVPRVRAAITGQRADGSEVPGEYLDGRPYAEGFAENAEFFELDYLDSLEVELGERFADLVPTLWLAAGARGERSGVERGTYAVPDAVPYAFLFDASGVRGLLENLEDRLDVLTVFVQAITDEAFADLREQLPVRVQAVKLYGSYVDHFRRALR